MEEEEQQDKALLPLPHLQVTKLLVISSRLFELELEYDELPILLELVRDELPILLDLEFDVKHVE